MFKKEILENQRKILDVKIIKRDFNIDEIISVLNLNKIISFIGPRRAGKTFLTFQVVKELIEKNIIELENVVYIDFSGILNKDLDLELIENSYFELFPNMKPFFIFDEVQELENFAEKLIKFLNKGYKIFVTGSNAHLLSKEISTILRGKVYTKEIFPLDFKEFLKFRNINFSKEYLILNKSKYKSEFINFLKWGGFPEIVLTENEFVKQNILKTYFDVMIYKDLQDRYRIKNDFALNFFIKRVLTSFSKELNINKIFNELKSKGIKIGKDSLYNFYEYLHNIYLIEPIDNFWAKIKGLKKNYLIDVSFANLIGNDDLGQRFENFVFLELKKKYGEIYFLSKNYKIDFFIPEKNKFIQVVYSLNYENIERETKNLAKQDGEKFLIYFEKEEGIITDERINYIDFSEINLLLDLKK